MKNIREQLEPMIRKQGIRETARRSSVSHSTLVQWCNGGRHLNEDQICAVVKAVGARVNIRRSK